MKEAVIRLDTINDVKDFCNAATKNQGEVLLVSDRYVINGKSFQGIISLDLSKPIKMEAEEPINKDFVKDIKKFIA